MKVKIEFTVEIDPDAWILNYGCEPHQVRDDVKSYCRYGVFDQLENVGVLKVESLGALRVHQEATGENE